MSLILNIDTATETGSVCIAEDGRPLITLTNHEQRDHAAWIHIAIENMMQQSGHSLRDVVAIAVTGGPGSYTGLRVGMATAKGLCYALHIPLITVSTLKMMAFAANSVYTNRLAYLCPMIDARRMEVFTGVYDTELKEVIAPLPVILDSSSFQDILDKDSILFFGSGATKFQQVCQHKNAFFKEVIYSAAHLSQLSYENLLGDNFTDLVFAEPVYLK